MVASAAAACGGKGGKGAAGVDHARMPEIPDGGLPGVGNKRARVVTSVPRGTMGPFWASHGGVRMLGQLLPAESGARSLVVAKLGDGTGVPPSTIPLRVPADTNAFALRETGATGVFVAGYSYLVERGEALSLALIGEDGAVRGKPLEVARTTNDIVWFEVLPTEKGALCVWAEETRGDDAHVLAVAIDLQGQMRGVPARVARGLTGWQIAGTPTGAALAVVSRDKDAPQKPQTLSLIKIDGDARAADPVVVARGAFAGDVEIARTARGWLFAWTDRGEAEPHVAVASVDDLGKPTAPRKLAELPGGAALFGIASGPAGVVVAWEERRKRTQGSRRVYLARTTEAGVRESKPYVVELAGKGAFELAATPAGFVFLADRRTCEPGGAAQGSCTGPIAPMVTRLSRDMDPTSAEIVEDGEGTASLAWGLKCDGEACAVLAARGDDVTKVSAVALEGKPPAPAAQAKVAPPIPADAPKITALDTLASGDTIADVAVAGFGDVAAVATLSAVLEDPGKPQAKGATITVRTYDKAGVLGATNTISTRALTVGGVAIAPAEKAEDGGAIAWVARENGDPEVHVTRVDKKGKRTNDIQLTQTKGDATDVAIASTAGGWIVAWVDGRHGPGEVYATKVSYDLSRIAREERITNAPGDKSDVVLQKGDDGYWIAWSDPRESPKDAYSDVYLALLRANDVKRAAGEIKVLASAAHSRSPRLAPAPGGGVIVAWIEEAPSGMAEGGEAFGAMVAAFDKTGKPSAPPTKIRLAGDGAAQAIAIEASGAGLRGVVARASKDEIVLDSVDLAGAIGAAPARVFPLIALEGPSSMDVALRLFGGVLYFNDDGPEVADRRARRATIAWRP